MKRGCVSVAFVGLLLGAAPPEESMIDLRDLKELGTFEVTLTGASHRSFLGNQQCVWWEWDYGTKLETGDWQTVSVAYHSEDDLVVHTPRGNVELSWRSLRPHITPTTEETWATKKDARRAPDVIREAMAEAEGPVTATEYCLREGQKYFARVDIETYWLPPTPPDFEPGEGQNAVLMLSDKPFEDGRPVVPRTPLFKGWSY